MYSYPKKALFLLLLSLFFISCASLPFPGAWQLEDLENKRISASEKGRILTFRPDGQLKITLPDGDERQAYWRWKDKGESVILTKDLNDLDAELYRIQKAQRGELRLLDEKGVISRFRRVPAKR